MPNPSFFLGVKQKQKRKGCANPSTPHPLTVTTLCHLAIKNCQLLKNTHDAFLTVLIGKEKKRENRKKKKKEAPENSIHITIK